MTRPLRIASVLFTLERLRGQPGARQAVLEELDRNRAALAGHGLDLVVFSEGVEAIGQSMDEGEALADPGPVLQAYQRLAVEESCTVAGSVKLVDRGQVHNSIAYIGPDGAMLGAYHKVFLTDGEIERGLVPGAGAVVVETPVGRLGGAICFDLNFEELAAEYAALQPDVITFASMYHGGLAQTLWAYRCRSYFVSALPFHGGGVIDPFGRPVATTDCYSAIALAEVNLDRALVHLDYNRVHFDAIRRKYRGQVVVDVPANVGSALIVSRSAEVSAMDVVREFDLLLLDDYFARSRDRNVAARPVLVR